MVARCAFRYSLGLKRGGAIAALALMAGLQPQAALAQDDEPDALSRPVVQQIPQSAGTRELNSALTRLAANSRDIDALIDAGNAAALLRDFEAAMGFFGRANQIAPANPGVKAGLAMALLRNENPYDALQYFDEAIRAGAAESLVAADRGLAYDLVGDNARAQRDYQIALARAPSDEVTRRYALSLAISGNRNAADTQLLPLLRRQDSAAWRTRAFIYAINGDEDEAISIAYATMPREMAEGVAPYLRYMTRLTKAQKAAAANFGHFPRAAQIGRDDPRVTRWASAGDVATGAGGADSALVPVGEPLGARSGRGTAGRDQTARSTRRTATVSRQPRRRPGGGQSAETQAAAVVPAGPALPAAGSASPPIAAISAAPPPSLELPPINTSPAPAPAQLAVAAPTPAPTPAAAAPGFETIAAADPAVTAPVQQPAQPAAQGPAMASSNFDLGRLDWRVRGEAAPAAAGVTTADLEAVQAARNPVPAPVAEITPAPAPAQPAVLAIAEPAAVTPPPVTSPPVTPPAVTPPAASPVARPSLDSLFADYRPPEDEAQTRIAAVDLSRITPARPRPAEPPAVAAPAPASGTARARPGQGGSAAAVQARQNQPAATTATGRQAGRAASNPAAAHPSRVWVQLATSPERDAMAGEWRRLGRIADSALRGKRGYVTPWRNNFRLLTGPFESERAAQAFLNSLNAEEVQGFVWTSAVGQVIDSLPGGSR